MARKAMKQFTKPWDMKVKYFAMLTLCVSLIFCIVYYTNFTEDVSHVGAKSDFFQRKKNHRFRSIQSSQIARLVELSDIEKFKEILKPLLVVRTPGSSGHIGVQEYIKKYMTDLDWLVSEDRFVDRTPDGPTTFTNIIANYNNAPRKLTLACHYDSKKFDFKFIAATDSAVPCAMLLDLARTLKDFLKSPTKMEVHDVSLQFLFLDGEEAFHHWSDTDSIYGARHLAQVMQENTTEVLREVVVTELQRIDAFILLDLIGTANPQFSNWFPTLTGKMFEKLQYIERVLRSSGYLEPKQDTASVNRYFVGGPRSGGGIQDDHIPFLHRNVKILHLICYPFPWPWHKITDNEAALDYPTIDNLNNILRVFVAMYLHLNV